MSEKRGCGLWLWKPYFINKVVKEARDGDVIFYCDSGAFFIKPITSILHKLSDSTPLFVCDIPLIESCWTKPTCFKKMGLNDKSIKESNQIIGTYFCFIVNQFTRKFIEEWLTCCCDYELLSPAGYGKNQLPSYNMGKQFVSHREDQSIFSLLCKKYDIKPHKDISQRGNNPRWYYSPLYAYKEPVHGEDNYNPILFLHKQPALNIGYFLRYFKHHILKRIICQ